MFTNSSFAKIRNIIFIAQHIFLSVKTNNLTIDTLLPQEKLHIICNITIYKHFISKVVDDILFKMLHGAMRVFHFLFSFYLKTQR